MIKFQCECGRKIAAPDQWLGKRVKCPQCGKPVLVQEALPVTPAAEPAPVEKPAAERRIEPAPAVRSAPPAHIPDDPDPAEPDSRFDFDSGLEGPAFTAADNGLDDIGDADGASRTQTEPEQEADDGPAEPPPAPAVPVTPTSPAPPRVPPRRKVFVPPKGPPPRFDEFGEMSITRVPNVLGILALLTGLVAAGLYWVPVLEWYVSPAVAGGGLFLALIGLIWSFARHRQGIAYPILAILVCGAAGSLTWSLPALMGPPTQAKPAPVHNWSLDNKTDAGNESMRRAVLAVDSLELTGDKNGPTGTVEYKLTNKGNKAIKTVEGSVQLYDKDHRLLGGLSLDSDFGKSGLAPGASTNGKKTWPMDESIQQPLADNRVTAEYRATRVVYADDSVETFDK